MPRPAPPNVEHACAGSGSTGTAAESPASSASFQELLVLLLAKYDSLRAENDALRDDKTREVASPTDNHPDPGAGLGKYDSPRAENKTREVARSTGNQPDPGAGERPGQGQHVSSCAGGASEEKSTAGESEAGWERTTSKSEMGIRLETDQLHASPSPQLGPEVHETWEIASSPVRSQFSGHWSNFSIPESLREPTSDRSRLTDTTTVLARLGSIFVLSPNGTKRLMWDSLGMLLLVFDLLHLPLMAFFEPSSVFERNISLMTTVFWTLDVPVSFLRGYYSSFALELDLKRIGARYIKREFLPDLIVCSIDWTLLLAETGAGSLVALTRVTKVIRIIRIARILRLVRLAKVGAFVEMLEASTRSIGIRTLITMVKNLLLIIVVNHFIACGWYAVGGLATPSWIDVLDDENRSTSYRYITALHWSITQFTPASMEVRPTNLIERVFAIVVIFIGLVMFSSFVSGITSSMTTFRMDQQQRSYQKEFMRRYISENNLSMTLTSRISDFLGKYRFGEPGRVSRSKVSLFRALPQNLRLMIDSEVYQQVLVTVPFLRECSEFSPAGMLNVCHRAVDEVSMGSCEELFRCGQDASAMYITIAGCMHYYIGFCELDPEVIQGGGNTRISESALWLRWVHQGRVFSMTPSVCVSIEPQRLAQALVHQPTVVLAAKQHAHLYCTRMEEEASRTVLEQGGVLEQVQAGSSWTQETLLHSDLYVVDHDVAVEMAHSSFTESVVRHAKISTQNRSLSRTLT